MNFFSPFENRGVPYEQAWSATHEIAATLELTDLLERNPLTLSGGEIKRLAIGIGSCALAPASGARRAIHRA